MAEDEDTGEKTKTGLVDPSSTYYTKLETNVLTFKNLSWVPDIATHDTATGITLTIDDKTDGHYPIYNATDGRILSLREVERLRTLKADMISTYTGNSLLNGNEIILGQVPKTNTMINILGTLTESQVEVVTEDNFDSIFGLNQEDFEAAINSNLEELRNSRQELQNTLNQQLEMVKDIGVINQQKIDSLEDLNENARGFKT